MVSFCFSASTTPVMAVIRPSSSSSSTASTSSSSSYTSGFTSKCFLSPLPVASPCYSMKARTRRSQVVCMAPEEEKMTRRSPLDFPIEWERPKPGRRPDIFPQFSPMKTPLPPPMPADPPEEDEEDEEQKEEEEEDPEKEEQDNPDKQQ